MSEQVLFSPMCLCGQPHESLANGRRQWLKSGLKNTIALALGGLAGGFSLDSSAQGAAAQPAAAGNRRSIDVHHHLAAPTFVSSLKSRKLDTPPVTNWSVQKSLDDMDKGGTATAMMSVFQPQMFGLDPAEAARIARESNEFAKKVETDHKGRFGTWAVLPLPHVDASLKEIEYAFDTLKVDGIGVMTSYGDKWLGYAEFEPVWAELNRRKATVYTHPTGPDCCVNLVRGVSDAMIEYGTDTARSIFTIIFSGIGAKYPDINWIWSHGGGSLTAFYERFTVQALMGPPYQGKFTRADVEKQIGRFYYDTAAIPNDVTLAAVKKMVPVSQILYGTDYPYRKATDYTAALLKNFTPDELRAIDRDNALRLVPRFKDA
jgi:predicted TIM-barrel fold metal-dependent hydrolase